MTAPKRIQLRRTRGWRKPEGAVVVARPSKWGNPYALDAYREQYPEADEHELRTMVVADFRGLVTLLWAPEYERDAITELAGRDLACWCPLDQPCHADVLLDIANNPTERKLT